VIEIDAPDYGRLVNLQVLAEAAGRDMTFAVVTDRKHPMWSMDFKFTSLSIPSTEHIDKRVTHTFALY
jgi:hypothetical protein